MKKFFALMLSIAIVSSLLVSCGDDVVNTTSTTLSTNSIVGSWSYVADNEENVFTFYEDGTLLNQVYVFGCYAQEVKGTYDADATTANIDLKDYDIDASYSFNQYNNLVLTFGGNSYTYNRVKPFTTNDYKDEHGYYEGLWADVPTPLSLFDDGHFAKEDVAYNFNIRESQPEKAKYGVNYNYFFENEEQAQSAFSKYYTYLLEDKFTLPKDSKSLKEKVKKGKVSRNLDKESKFEISRNIFVSKYTDEEIGVGLCYDTNEKRVVLSVTIFNKKYDVDDYVKDRANKINYVYKDVIVTKHRSDINPNDYHIVSMEIVYGGNKVNSSASNNNQGGGNADTPSEPAAIGEEVKVNITPPSLDSAFKSEAESAEKSAALDTYQRNNEAEMHVTDATLSDTMLYLKMGEKKQLTATVLPDDSSVDKSLFWTSDNEDVAVIDKNGTVYALKSGAATITAISYDSQNIERTCTVIVSTTDGAESESNALTALINQQRKSNGVAELPTKIEIPDREYDVEKLQRVADERSFEEAYENDGIMDGTRPDGRGNDTILSDYNLYERGRMTFYLWGKGYDAQTAFNAMKDSEAGKMLCSSDAYTHLAAGCYKDEATGVVFWTIMAIRAM